MAAGCGLVGAGLRVNGVESPADGPRPWEARARAGPHQGVGGSGAVVEVQVHVPEAGDLELAPARRARSASRREKLRQALARPAQNDGFNKKFRHAYQENSEASSQRMTEGGAGYLS